MTRRASTRNASVQEWRAYLDNRAKRNRDGRFLVHGRDSISRAVAHEWPLETLLYRLGGPDLPGWARDLLDTSGVPSTGLVSELMAELAESATGVPELVALAHSRNPELDGFTPGEPGQAHPPVVVVVERPASAERLGSLVRSADAFGATAVVISGPGADQYDPRCVRASAGSLFALPVFRVSGPAPLRDFRERQARRGVRTRIVGVAAHPDADVRAVYDQDFAAATVLVIGDEDDLGPAWRKVCDEVVSVPVGGALPAPCAASIALYEISRQRRALR